MTGATVFFLTLASLVSYIAWLWPIELLAHFRPQYLIISLIISGILLVCRWRGYFKNRLLIIAALVLVGLNAVEIIPWYLPHSKQITICIPINENFTV
ncbi:MAG: hypothetical protein HC908_07550 [Calothrix sp. SM1_7_51]|nr:hypothetical protein [Calothrix sp. SM1_7_51]